MNENQRALTLSDATLGCLLGACIGDAAGAVLEFREPPSPADVAWAMTMPGGGVWGVAPGQITDDSELMLCLAQALAESPTFDRERIARNYAAWIDSPPFDIGTTTSRSLGAVRGVPTSYATTMTQAAARHCMESKSNGSLMRATPLGVWGRRLSPDELADCARQDSCLSHPNPSCWQAVACYSIAIAHLLNHLGDRQGAFAAAQRWARVNANAEVQSWLTDAEQNRLIPYTPQIGFVRIGFTHAFRHLWLGTDFVTALAETLAGGGDTDTNACIVGGLLGAAYGAEAIPLSMRQAVLTCDTAKGRVRPAFLHTKQIPALVTKMLTIVGES
jgi:ADP-ribosylglycohydrolase